MTIPVDYRTKEERVTWLFSPFWWAIWASLCSIAPVGYWYLGKDHPTSTIFSLIFVISAQAGFTLWGIRRLHRATQGQNQ